MHVKFNSVTFQTGKDWKGFFINELFPAIILFENYQLRLILPVNDVTKKLSIL